MQDCEIYFDDYIYLGIVNEMVGIGKKFNKSKEKLLEGK